MSSQYFAHRPILNELTEVVNSRELDPYEAYSWLYEQQSDNSLKAETYLSSSITSGGHSRDKTITKGETIARNIESARLLAEQLANDRQIRAEGAVEPVMVGKTHWNQAQFMEFWLSVIGGFQFTPWFMSRDVDKLRSTAQHSFDVAGLDLELMNSIEKSPETRAIEYFKMSAAFAGLITDGMSAKPVDAVIRMVDTHLSLGAQTERAYAKQIGVKVMNICAVKPASITDLAAENHVLAQDVEHLIQFGATVFDTRFNRARLLLEPEVA